MSSYTIADYQLLEFVFFRKFFANVMLCEICQMFTSVSLVNFSICLNYSQLLRLKVEANKGKSALRTNLKYNGAI